MNDSSRSADRVAPGHSGGMSRRRFMQTTAATTGITLASAHVSASAHVPVASADDTYFATVSNALKEAGLMRPTMVVDRARLRANIATLREHLRPEMAYRAVTKSLPAAGLIGEVMVGAGTRKLMAFHQPFINRAAVLWPDASILLGKPMPVGAAATFYRDLAPGGFDPAHQIEWLVDTPARLAEYARFAATREIDMKINLELDVGFHRGGIRDAAAMAEALAIIAASDRLTLAGMMGYDGHVSIFPQLVGPPEVSVPRTSALFSAFIDQAREHAGLAFDPESATLNTAGSTTYQLYGPGGFATPANDIAIGSGLIKPTFCDKALPDHAAAAFIATPVLKALEGVTVPGLEHDPDGGADDDLPRDRTIFLYGGRWMADPVHPAAMQTHPVYGRSSNQDMFTLPANVRTQADDIVFFRPRQTEAVLLQFGDIAVFEDGRIVDTWQPLDTF